MLRLPLSGGLACVLLLQVSSLPVPELARETPYLFDYHYNLTIETADGTLLRADAAVPRPKSNETFPILIFPNSWGMPEIEYVAKTLEWAARGYIMLEYETRGWYNSGGVIGTAGPQDQNDTSYVIDFALKQKDWSPNPDKIGFCGISYGAGLSLFAAALDTRVKTAIALSGWADMLAALDQNETPSLVWGSLLVALAKLVGKPPPELQELFDDLTKHKNTSFVLDFAATRSPAKHIDSLNKRQVPIMISNNFEDRLFKPQDALTFYQQLQTPKMVLLNQGIHASAEIGGLVGLPNNYIWNKVGLWVDYWLKGVETGIMAEPPLQFELRAEKSARTTFTEWPSTLVETKTYYMGSRSRSIEGKLSLAPEKSEASDGITFSKLDGLTAGVPVVGPVLQAYVDIPIVAELPLVSRKHAIVYQSDALSGDELICGTPNVTLTVVPNKLQYQLVAYLYSVNVAGLGTLISHAPFTSYDSVPGTRETAAFSLRTLCDRVPKGHRLALGVSMFDILYEPANTDSDLEVQLVTGGSAASTLALPFHN